MLRSIRRALQGASNGIRTTDNGWQFHVQSQASGWGLASEGMFAASLQGTPLRSLSNGATSAARRNVLGRLDISPVHTRLPGAHARFWTGGPVGSRGWSISSARRTYSSISPENVVFSIMIVNFGVFMAWKQPSLGQVMSKHFITSYSHLRAGYFHTLLTHAVSHKDAMHLFSNMVTFYFFGSSLGGIIGSARLLQLYAAAAVTGGIAQSSFDKRSAGLGASAAVNAIVIFSVLLNPTATYLVYGIVPLPAWALGIGWLAYDSMGAYKGGGNVAYFAHLGGAVVGVAGFAALTSGLW